MTIHTIPAREKRLPTQCQHMMHGSSIRRKAGVKFRESITNQCPNAPVGWRDGMAFCQPHLHATYKKKSAKYAKAVYD